MRTIIRPPQAQARDAQRFVVASDEGLVLAVTVTNTLVLPGGRMVEKIGEQSDTFWPH